MRRFAPFQVAILVCIMTGAAASALAVPIDPELAALMAVKSDREVLPVLLVFDDPPDISDLIQDLDKLDPEKRRKLVLEMLKKKALKAQLNAMDVLDRPEWGDQVRGARQLYLAGAIVFDGSPAVIEALARLKDPAVLYHDKPYDLVTGTRIGIGGPPPDKYAAVDTAWSVKYIRADKVWRELGITGEGVVVGDIDTGISLTHPDLVGRLWVNPGEIPGNGLDDDGNGFIDDVHGYDLGVDDGNPDDDAPGGGHGTHTAGTVVGDGSGGIVTGMAPGARIMALKVWQEDGTGGSLGMIWAAEQYCVENGARIITMSLGIPGYVAPIFMRNERYNCNNIRDAGVLLVNSAGNDHGDAFTLPPIEINLTARVPAPWNALPVPYSSTGGVLTVGASGYKDDSYYPGSSQGPVNWGNVDPWLDWAFDPGPGLVKPDIAAPGTRINSTVRTGGYSGDTWTGTSMACPHVAGVAALMLQKNPTLSPAGLDSLLELSAVDLGAPGKDNIYGSGRLDAFAAVSAVPGIAAANLSYTGIVPDHDGDGVLDPGQTSPVAFTLQNVSPTVAAVAVSARLAVKPDEFVTVADGSAAFGDMSAGGGKGDNLADPFLLDVDPEAPQGHPFTMLLTIETGAFARTFDIPWYVGLPEHRTHDIGNIFLTVTDQGVLGYLGQDGAEGQGMGVIGGPSSLFIGSFWAGTGPDYICNNDYDGLGKEVHEWVVSNAKDDNGRVRDLGANSSDQTFRSIFHDGGHASPLPLFVEQNSFAFTGPPNDDFVILDYALTNQSGEPVANLFAGVYCDFDIDDSTVNQGGTDPGRNLAYIYSGEGPYYGIAVLDSLPAVNLTMVNNPTYVYTEYTIEDQDKFDLISGGIRQPNGQRPDDWSLLVSTALSLDPGETGTVVFAMLYGETLADLQANTDAAFAAYSLLDPLTDEVPVKFVRLDQNIPNPFNPLTRITFELGKAGPVDLAVYDLRGLRVRTLMTGERPAGPGEFFWDGTDDRGRALPSGIYLYRLSAPVGDVSRKMTLVR